MKAVRDEAALLPSIAQARREASAAFGNDTLYVERLVERPRHVEIQVIRRRAWAGAVHLFERECSIQRRHQKIVEESPSPALTPRLRARMGEAAVAVARAAGYRNAGTIEFLLDGTGDDAQFYFLEMNTRLQVEHPVTEQVTGIDLVRAQIAVAAGGKLPWRRTGWRSAATRSRRGSTRKIRARDDLPQAGPLLLYREPAMPGIRVDAGVVEGSHISVHYDPMIAKLIASGETREAARRRALAALRSYPILGIRTNVPLLIALLEHPRFVSGDLDTHFLDRERAALRADARDRAAGTGGCGCWRSFFRLKPEAMQFRSRPRCRPLERRCRMSASDLQVTPLGTGRYRVTDGDAAMAGIWRRRGRRALGVPRRRRLRDRRGAGRASTGASGSRRDRARLAHARHRRADQRASRASGSRREICCSCSKP